MSEENARNTLNRILPGLMASASDNNASYLSKLVQSGEICIIRNEYEHRGFKSPLMVILSNNCIILISWC